MMESTSKESRVVLALQAIQNDPNLSVRKAAAVYNVNRATLQNRKGGRRARQDTRANSLRLSELEQEAILRYILDLEPRGFPPRLTDVEDMANILLAEHDAGRVGKNWAYKFV